LENDQNNPVTRAQMYVALQIAAECALRTILAFTALKLKEFKNRKSVELEYHFRNF
jgi:hypothetical protein